MGSGTTNMCQTSRISCLFVVFSALLYLSLSVSPFCGSISCFYCQMLPVSDLQMLSCLVFR